MSVLSYIVALTAYSAAVNADSNSAFLNVPLSRRAVQPRPDFSILRRRYDSIEVPHAVHCTHYFIDFELGSPPQRLSLELSTSSSDVFIPDARACYSVTTCSRNSTFFDDDSSSFHTNDTYFGAKGYSGGQWAQDTLHLAGRNITDFNFGLVNKTSHLGAFGIGLTTNEYVDDSSDAYANLPQQLKQQGIIRQAAYALWLNNEGDAESVLFGGIDHAKYSSDLYVLPLVKTYEEDSAVTDFAVQLTGLSIFDAAGNEQPFATCDLPAVLDLSAPISALPIDVIHPFYDTLDVLEYDWNTYLVPCDALSSSDGGIGIHLAGVDVTVGFSDLFVSANVTDSAGTAYCVPGFVFTSDLPAVIGQNILRTLYVVYDLENFEVGIAAAQTGSSASTSSIEALSTGIPGTRVGNATAANDTVSYLATEQITLITPSASRTAEASLSTGLESVEGLTTWGYTYVPWTAPATESFVIGAKAGAQSTKASNATTSASSTPSASSTSSTANGSSGPSAAAGVGSQNSAAASESRSGDDRQPQTSSSRASSPPTSQPARASSSAAGSSGSSKQQASSSAGAPVPRAMSLFTVVAGLVLALL